VRALRILAGKQAMAHLQGQGLSAADIAVIAGAAGGPKGLILGPLDRFLFGHWLQSSNQPIDLVGASIGAWRLASACLNQPEAALQKLEHDYIHQHYQLPAGQRRPSAKQVSEQFSQSLNDFYAGRLDEILNHPRYKLHVMTSHGKHLLSREGAWRTPAGYALAYLFNACSRRLLGHWLERVVFSSPNSAGLPAELPFHTRDFPTLHYPLNADNFMPAVQASCSIPFMLQAVHDIPSAASGAYWDGGITDYHLHLDYSARKGLVLYPHFQAQVVPGWLDKAWKSRHRATDFLDQMILLCPSDAWIASLPNSKLPDRSDFLTYGQNLAARVKVWQQAVDAAQQLSDEFQTWLENPGFIPLERLN
jgi:hypothetical protein